MCAVKEAASRWRGLLSYRVDLVLISKQACMSILWVSMKP